MSDKLINYNIILAAMEGTIKEVSNFLKAGEPVNSKSEHSDSHCISHLDLIMGRWYGT